MLVQEHGKQLDVGGAGLAERGGRDLPLATREVVVPVGAWAARASCCSPVAA